MKGLGSLKKEIDHLNNYERGMEKKEKKFAQSKNTAKI